MAGRSDGRVRVVHPPREHDLDSSPRRVIHRCDHRREHVGHKLVDKWAGCRRSQESLQPGEIVGDEQDNLGLQEHDRRLSPLEDRSAPQLGSERGDLVMRHRRMSAKSVANCSAHRTHRSAVMNETIRLLACKRVGRHLILQGGVDEVCCLGHGLFSHSSAATGRQSVVFRHSSSGTRLQALVFHGESLRCVRDTQARRPTAKTEGMVSDYGPHTQAGCVRSPDARVQ